MIPMLQSNISPMNMTTWNYSYLQAYQLSIGVVEPRRWMGELDRYTQNDSTFIRFKQKLGRS